jgi:organic radical activating enzyme
MKIKKFVTCLVPVNACNFRCSYCYLSHHIQNNAYSGKIYPFIMESSKIAQSLSPERLGGFCYFNLCAAGETMLHPQIISLVDELTKKGHFVDIVTNGTVSKRFDELINDLSADQKKRTFIKFSFHYLELKKRDLIEKFISNVEKIKNAGISYTIEITPHDELIPYIDEIKEFSIREFGAWPHITVARNEGTDEIALLTELNREEYSKIWGTFDSEMFRFKLRLFNQKRCEFCYAGLWSISVNLKDGCYDQCYIGNRLGNICDIEKPLNFMPIGKCKEPHCFNGHAFLGFGDIPEIGTDITYAMERDRVTNCGEHWLKPDMREFFSSKLYESNDQLTNSEKKSIFKKNKILFCDNIIKRTLNKIKTFSFGN